MGIERSVLDRKKNKYYAPPTGLLEKERYGLRQKGIDEGRTQALEGIIGLKTYFNEQGIADAGADWHMDAPILTADLAPIKGDHEMIARIMAAADLLFGARPILHLIRNAELGKFPSTKNTTVLTRSMLFERMDGVEINPKKPVSLVENAGNFRCFDQTKSGFNGRGSIVFTCMQEGKAVAKITVEFAYVPTDPAKSNIATLHAGMEALGMRPVDGASRKVKDSPQPAAKSLNELEQRMGILKDEVAAPAFGMNYWDVTHGSWQVLCSVLGTNTDDCKRIRTVYESPAITRFAKARPQPEDQNLFALQREREKGDVVLSQGLAEMRRICCRTAFERDPRKTVKRVGSVHHSYLRSASGFEVKVERDEVIGTVSRLSPLKLPACVDQIFPYFVQKDFGMLMGPTIAMEVCVPEALDEGIPLEIRQSAPCSMRKAKSGKLIGTVKMGLSQYGQEVGTSIVTCLLSPPSEIMAAIGKASTVDITLRRTGSRIRHAIGNKFPVVSKLVLHETRAANDDGGLVAKMVSSRRMRNDHEEIMLNSQTPNRGGFVHGGISAAIALEGTGWKKYQLSYPAMGEVGSVFLRYREGETIILRQWRNVVDEKGRRTKQLIDILTAKKLS